MRRMAVDKKLITGSTDMLLMKLMEKEDMYGYQMIEELRKRSNNVFDMKAGTLYPLLHQLEQKGYLTSYDRPAGEARMRKYYRLTKEGRAHLVEREKEWRVFAGAVGDVLEGGALIAAH